jgi:hypothetical protein
MVEPENAAVTLLQFYDQLQEIDKNEFKNLDSPGTQNAAIKKLSEKLFLKGPVDHTTPLSPKKMFTKKSSEVSHFLHGLAAIFSFNFRERRKEKYHFSNATIALKNLVEQVKTDTLKPAQKEKIERLIHIINNVISHVNANEKKSRWIEYIPLVIQPQAREITEIQANILNKSSQLKNILASPAAQMLDYFLDPQAQANLNVAFSGDPTKNIKPYVERYNQLKEKLSKEIRPSDLKNTIKELQILLNNKYLKKELQTLSKNLDTNVKKLIQWTKDNKEKLSQDFVPKVNQQIGEIATPLLPKPKKKQQTDAHATITSFKKEEINKLDFTKALNNKKTIATLSELISEQLSYNKLFGKFPLRESQMEKITSLLTPLKGTKLLTEEFTQQYQELKEPFDNIYQNYTKNLLTPKDIQNFIKLQSMDKILDSIYALYADIIIKLWDNEKQNALKELLPGVNQDIVNALRDYNPLPEAAKTVATQIEDMEKEQLQQIVELYQSLAVRAQPPTPLARVIIPEPPKPEKTAPLEQQTPPSQKPQPKKEISSSQSSELLAAIRKGKTLKKTLVLPRKPTLSQNMLAASLDTKFETMKAEAQLERETPEELLTKNKKAQIQGINSTIKDVSPLLNKFKPDAIKKWQGSVETLQKQLGTLKQNVTTENQNAISDAIETAKTHQALLQQFTDFLKRINEIKENYEKTFQQKLSDSKIPYLVSPEKLENFLFNKIDLNQATTKQERDVQLTQLQNFIRTITKYQGDLLATFDPEPGKGHKATGLGSIIARVQIPEHMRAKKKEEAAEDEEWLESTPEAPKKVEPEEVEPVQKEEEEEIGKKLNDLEKELTQANVLPQLKGSREKQLLLQANLQECFKNFNQWKNNQITQIQNPNTAIPNDLLQEYQARINSARLEAALHSLETGDVKLEAQRVYWYCTARKTFDSLPQAVKEKFKNRIAEFDNPEFLAWDKNSIAAIKNRASLDNAPPQEQRIILAKAMTTLLYHTDERNKYKATLQIIAMLGKPENANKILGEIAGDENQQSFQELLDETSEQFPELAQRCTALCQAQQGATSIFERLKSLEQKITEDTFKSMNVVGKGASTQVSAYFAKKSKTIKDAVRSFLQSKGQNIPGEIGKLNNVVEEINKEIDEVAAFSTTNEKKMYYYKNITGKLQQDVDKLKLEIKDFYEAVATARNKIPDAIQAKQEFNAYLNEIVQSLDDAVLNYCETQTKNNVLITDAACAELRAKVKDNIYKQKIAPLFLPNSKELDVQTINAQIQQTQKLADNKFQQHVNHLKAIATLYDERNRNVKIKENLAEHNEAYWYFDAHQNVSDAFQSNLNTLAQNQHFMELTENKQDALKTRKSLNADQLRRVLSKTLVALLYGAKEEVQNSAKTHICQILQYSLQDLQKVFAEKPGIFNGIIEIFAQDERYTELATLLKNIQRLSTQKDKDKTALETLGMNIKNYFSKSENTANINQLINGIKELNNECNSYFT